MLARVFIYIFLNFAELWTIMPICRVRGSPRGRPEFVKLLCLWVYFLYEGTVTNIA